SSSTRSRRRGSRRSSPRTARTWIASSTRARTGRRPPTSRRLRPRLRARPRSAPRVDPLLARRPDWNARTDEQALGALSPAATRALTSELLGELGAATRADASVDRRLAELRQRTEQSGEVAYHPDGRGR